ncbi:hypothetical protein ACH6CV_16805 [Bacillota bacterium Meth-B3]
MSQSDEIARLERDNEWLAAQVDSQRAEIGYLRQSIPPLLLERDQLAKQVEVLTDHIRKARHQRDAYRAWADRLDKVLGAVQSVFGWTSEIMMAYRQWRGDQP